MPAPRPEPDGAYTRVACPMCGCAALIDWQPAPSHHGRIMEHSATIGGLDLYFATVAEMRCPATGRTVRRV